MHIVVETTKNKLHLVGEAHSPKSNKELFKIFESFNEQPDYYTCYNEDPINNLLDYQSKYINYSNNLSCIPSDFRSYLTGFDAISTCQGICEYKFYINNNPDKELECKDALNFLENLKRSYSVSKNIVKCIGENEVEFIDNYYFANVKIDEEILSKVYDDDFSKQPKYKGYCIDKTFVEYLDEIICVLEKVCDDGEFFTIHALLTGDHTKEDDNLLMAVLNYAFLTSLDVYLISLVVGCLDKVQGENDGDVIFYFGESHIQFIVEYLKFNNLIN
jgi:hypothetical protein